MLRPSSIVYFERFFLASILVGFLTTALTWNDVMGEIERNAAMIGTGTTIAIVVAILAVTFGISLALWFFIARRASNVAKWIYVVLMGAGALLSLASIFDPASYRGLALAASLSSTLLTLASIACLFRADAVAWLTGKASVDPGIFE